IGVFIGVRELPTGTNLNHLDFRVTGGNVIEFCDPTNPQFLPVVQVRSPVTMTLSDAIAQQGAEKKFILTLKTGSGKAIAPEDLAVMHTKLLHLLVVDPTLGDYQHIHPEPGPRPGDWTFTMTPKRTGLYRVFADFTPVATGRGLYAVSEFTVSGTYHASDTWSSTEVTTADGYRFELTSSQKPFRARQQADLQFVVTRTDGGKVPMEPVMGAFAHLVAFDRDRLGFAHLHPDQYDISVAPDPIHPTLTFKLTIPQAGSYMIWGQVNLGGTERFVPFAIEVEK
ncbi:MAG TPA: hypothetical protein VKC60_05395, partial [Opitutaceae bacterium]|nr:hypothetical protein [Opitutaceae bacterium]